MTPIIENFLVICSTKCYKFEKNKSNPNIEYSMITFEHAVILYELWLFPWYSTIFGHNNSHLTSNKYHIWNQYKKLSRSVRISRCFFDFCFSLNFHPWCPLGTCEKMNSIKSDLDSEKASSGLVKCYLNTEI